MFIKFKTHFLKNAFTKFLIQLLKSLLLFGILDCNRYDWLALSWSFFFSGWGLRYLYRTRTLVEFNFLLFNFAEIEMPVFGIKRCLLNVFFNNWCLVIWDLPLPWGFDLILFCWFCFYFLIRLNKHTRNVFCFKIEILSTLQLKMLDFRCSKIKSDLLWSMLIKVLLSIIHVFTRILLFLLNIRPFAVASFSPSSTISISLKLIFIKWHLTHS